MLPGEIVGFKRGGSVRTSPISRKGIEVSLNIGGAVSDSLPKLRSRAWFDDASNPDMTALYLEKYLNYGLSIEELQSGKPIVGIAQTGSDLAPCNRHHLMLAERVRDGIR